MANKNHQIEVGISCSKGNSGVLSIHLKPWQPHIDRTDTVEWTAVTHNGDTRVLWTRVDKYGDSADWPFPEAPPHPSYSGKHDPNNSSKDATAKSSGARKYFATQTVVRYAITVGFLDADGHEREVTIDPDMVIEAG